MCRLQRAMCELGTHICVDEATFNKAMALHSYKRRMCVRGQDSRAGTGKGQNEGRALPPRMVEKSNTVRDAMTTTFAQTGSDRLLLSHSLLAFGPMSDMHALKHASPVLHTLVAPTRPDTGII